MKLRSKSIAAIESGFSFLDESLVLPEVWHSTIDDIFLEDTVLNHKSHKAKIIFFPIIF